MEKETQAVEKENAATQGKPLFYKEPMALNREVHSKLRVGDSKLIQITLYKVNPVSLFAWMHCQLRRPLDKSMIVISMQPKVISPDFPVTGRSRFAN